MEHRVVKRKKKRKKQKNNVQKALRIIANIFFGILGFIGILGIIFFILNQSGRSSLHNSSPNAAPDVSNDQANQIAAAGLGQLSTVAWQDDWIAIDGTVYAYDQNTINLLFLGIDQPGGISTEIDLTDWESGQTDAIFVLSLNSTDKTIKVLGIPRNAMVELEVYNEENQVERVFENQICLQYAYAGGGAQGLSKMSETVSELLFGLPIHGVVAIGYDAVGSINDQLGGVEVEVLEDMTEVNSKFYKGNYVHLAGTEALQYVRERDVSMLGSPTLRLNRQKQYLTALIGAAKNRLKEKPMIVADIYNSIKPYMNTDVTLDEAVYIAMEAGGYQFDGDSFYLLEGEDKAVTFTNSQGEEDFYDDLYLDAEKTKSIMVEVFYQPVVLEQSQQ